jgi:hypothetical protein
MPYKTKALMKPKAILNNDFREANTRQMALELASFWLALRIVASACAAIASYLSPLTNLEKSIALWPPTSPISSWLERVLLAPWQRWDAEWYLKIVTQGYRSGDGTAQFHPLYTWLAIPLTRLGIHPLLGLLLVSSISTLLLMLVFEQLARFDLNKENVRTSTILFILFPSAFILFAPYSESLFLLFAVSSFLFMRRNRWWLAGVSAGLAALTRQQGLFLLLPLAWEIWEFSGKDVQRSLRQWRDWLPLMLVPASYLIWLVYRWQRLSDLNLSTSNLNSIIYSFLISPSADQVVEVQAFLWPWQALWIALRQVFSSPDLDLVANLVFGAYFLVLLALAWKHLTTSSRIYSLVIIVVSFSYYTGPIHPYMGLLRHLLLAFPIFIGLVVRLRYPWQRLAVTAFNQVGYVVLLWLYVLHAWVP